MKILIIEDERELLNAIKEYLQSEGYLCEEAMDLPEGIHKIQRYKYDCVIADIGLPGGSGLKLIAELKAQQSDTGIIIISARNSLDDKINGLDLGSDDYLTKPFHLSELNARIKSLLRRRKFRGNNEVAFKEICLMPDTLRTIVKGSNVVLTKKEFDLLLYFISNPNKVLTKESIVEHLWGDYMDSTDSFDFIYTHVSNLRKKLIDNGSNDYVKTVYGVGYKFTAE
ncbi:MAG: response regulator transcription factor [Bacteroidota bacterium]